MVFLTSLTNVKAYASPSRIIRASAFPERTSIDLTAEGQSVFRIWIINTRKSELLKSDDRHG